MNKMLLEYKIRYSARAKQNLENIALGIIEITSLKHKGRKFPSFVAIYQLG
ncbi:hypothetical protein [Testudinibacter sp. TR-2022]|uniref:hypothetical protein n=1 Tax=Testudinibacter sp. TR-2022 TaxID=2585029 RepID=UPI00159BD6E8|nr:hypothetical protein [Testudinibacter sp. TR-2022]